MIKNITMCLLMLLAVTSCNKKCQASTNPTISVMESTNKLICIRDCGDFLSSREEVKFNFKMACKAATFNNLEIYEERYSDRISLYFIEDEYGYAILYVNTKDDCCSLEFHTENEKYDFLEFMSAFLVPLYMYREPSEDMYQTLAEILG